ncbi:C40 family peptidase [Niabella ginsengisoli]|uniref:C40 family peptidase n=1 Tax=Niabella ginsengisoli TaxID=522298 RepID=A0ABS9SF30_9BACT|nr:C40 family peptidase [Niabella ginsengisoli]MCH5596966.1 C40 family peptidase [Niabella ginsengisoli]
MPTQPEQMKAQQVAASSFSLKSATREKRVEDVINESKISDIDATEADLAALKLSIPTEVQVKYASLLNMLPGMLTNVKLLETIDEWYGTRYRYGGTTKRGIDCSAFVKAVYKVAFGIDLPRTAREQFKAAAMAVSNNLKQGDLLFFNTTGGISHVGMYLGNNKFVHASSGRGVTVSDLDENYYAARYLGARRMGDNSYYATN